MANPYEMVVLYHPDLEIDLDKPLKKVETIVKNQKGKVVNSDNWGKRKLAYPINGEDHAVYVYYDLELDPNNINKIEQNLNISDEVLRYIIVKPGPEPEEDDKKKDDTKEDNKESEESKTSLDSGKEDEE